MAPSVPDVLADTMKKIVDRERFKAMGIEQNIVREQRTLLNSGEKWCDVARCGFHDVNMSLVHE